jgi:hypothetical protein
MKKIRSVASFKDYLSEKNLKGDDGANSMSSKSEDKKSSLDENEK